MTDIELINKITNKLKGLDSEKTLLVIVVGPTSSNKQHEVSVLDIADYTHNQYDIQTLTLAICFLAASVSNLKAIGVINNPSAPTHHLTLELSTGLLLEGQHPYNALESFDESLEINRLKNFFGNGLKAKAEAENGNKNYLYDHGISFEQICKAEEIFYKISSTIQINLD